MPKSNATVKVRREHLYDQAARQMNLKGVSLTSLTELADELSISRASLYYYVEDRADLVFQVYRRSCEILARQLGEAARSGRTVRQVISSFLSSTLGPEEPEIAALNELGLLNPAERETVLGLYEGVVARLAIVLEVAGRSGEIRACDYSVVARSIVSTVHWVPLSSRWTVAVGPVSRADVIAAIEDCLWNGWASERSRPVNPGPIDLEPLVAKSVAAFDRDALAGAKRETILATASRLFNRKGVYTTSLDGIAAELGTTKRTLYHHVGNKQALVSACYVRGHRIQAYIREQAKARGAARIDTLVAILRAAAMAQQRLDIEPLRPLVGFEALPEAEQLLAAQRSREISDEYQSMFEDAQREGSMRTIDLRYLLLIFPGPAAWLAKGLVSADPIRQAEIAAEITDVLRVGIKPLSKQG